MASQEASRPVPGSRRLVTEVTLLGHDADEWRTGALRDTTARLSLFRSVSSMQGGLFQFGGIGLGLVVPRFEARVNGELPYSMNDGALWAGRGTNVLVTGGLRVEWRRLRVIALPELAIAQNRGFDTSVAAVFGERPWMRSPWSSPFHAAAQSIDLPVRYGSRPLRQLLPGQSSAMLWAGPLELGVSTENEWWGPGLRNALILSNNAPGFPHLSLRTPRPIETRAGTIEARWISGVLTESDYFDVDPSNRLRSIAMAGGTIQPGPMPGLTLGAARAVFAPVGNWRTGITRFLDVFRDVGQPNAVPITDSVTAPGHDQLFTLFAHWALPRDGVEFHVEWGRAEFPRSLRDFLESPNHSHGYTVGIQWLGEESPRLAGQLRLQAEATFVEQGATYAFRPIGSWYTSHAVAQGYTQRGQPLGASTGPGGSSQWLAADLLQPSRSLGLFVSRTRALEDARSQAFPSADENPDQGWCEHDVSLLGGLRGHLGTRIGMIRAEYGTGWRHNVFFKHAPSSCPLNTGTNVRLHTVGLSFAPRIR